RAPEDDGGGRAGGARRQRADRARFPDGRGGARVGQEDRAAGDAQGVGGRRRQGHAARRRREKIHRRVSGRAARGQERVRRRRRVPGEGGHSPAPRRDPGVRRRARQHRAPVRARLLDSAAPPEGDRGGAVAGGDAGAARQDGRGRGQGGGGGGLRRR